MLQRVELEKEAHRPPVDRQKRKQPIGIRHDIAADYDQRIEVAIVARKIQRRQTAMQIEARDKGLEGSACICVQPRDGPQVPLLVIAGIDASRRDPMLPCRRQRHPVLMQRVEQAITRGDHLGQIPLIATGSRCLQDTDGALELV